MGDHNAGGVELLAVCELVGDHLADDGFQIPAIFFRDSHLAVLHLDAGLEIEEVRAKHLHAGAAPALIHIKQRADDEGRAHLLGLLTDFIRNLGGGKALIAQLGGIDGQHAHPAGNVAGIDGIHIREVLGGHAGDVRRYGHLAADAQVHHLKALAGPLLIEILIISRSRGARCGKLSRLLIIRKQIGGMYIYSIQTRFVSQIDRQGNRLNSITLQQIAVQIAGAVRHYLYFFAHSPSSLL